MAIKKSELYSLLYQACDNLRGGMDPSQYKNYILTLLFVKYVTDGRIEEPYYSRFVSNRLSARVSELAVRYAETDPQLEAEKAALERAVAAHLREMGY